MRIGLCALILGCTGLLTACGGGGSGNAQTASEAFFASVAAIIAAPVADTATPVDIDAIVLGTSDTDEPAPI